MCEIAAHPYREVGAPGLGGTVSEYIIGSSIRDAMPCLYTTEPNAPQVIKLSGANAYLDLSVVAVQSVIAIVLLVLLPALFMKVVKKQRLALVSSALGVLYILGLIWVVSYHVGGDIVVPYMFGALAVLALPSLWLYKHILIRR